MHSQREYTRHSSPSPTRTNPSRRAGSRSPAARATPAGDALLDPPCSPCMGCALSASDSPSNEVASSARPALRDELRENVRAVERRESQALDLSGYGLASMPDLDKLGQNIEDLGLSKVFEPCGVPILRHNAAAPAQAGATRRPGPRMLPWVRARVRRWTFPRTMRPSRRRSST